MFRKIVSNLPFSPALVGQLGFYAKRLRKEESTRRIGLIFTALALVVQAFAVFSPPESANAANGNNVIYGGFTSKEQFLSMYDQNRDSAGHTDLQQIYTQFGITRQDIANSAQGSFNSRDFNLTIKSVGRSTYDWQRTPIAISGTATTVYESLLYKFDSTSWTTVHGSAYPALIGKRGSDGQWFAIMMGCGNPAYLSLPPPPPQPVAACSSLTITPVSRTRFTFNGKASTSNGASVSSYAYSVKDSSGKVIDTRSVASNQLTNTLNYDFTKDGSYTVVLTVTTSVGAKTDTNCQKPLTVSPESRCPLNPDIVASNPDCKPCEDDATIWYKDKNCKSTFELSKTVKNATQLKDDADGTTANPGDRLEYKLSVKNTGKTTGTYAIEDNMADVLEYADMIDTGGGTLTKKDAFTPVEKVNVITWPAISIKPGETVQKIISVQIKATIPATPKSVGNPESYNCRLVNDFSGHPTAIMVNCPTPKAVEQVVTELPKTGATENMIVAGVALAIITFFYARARQMKKEVRLIRKDLNAGTI
jgi:fimbrial isopeptide formation D2 family protein